MERILDTRSEKALVILYLLHCNFVNCCVDNNSTAGGPRINFEEKLLYFTVVVDCHIAQSNTVLESFFLANSKLCV